MRMIIHQRRIIGKIVISGVNAKVRVGDSGARHIQRINNFLEVRGRAVRGDLIGENDERLDGGEKRNALHI